MSRGEASPGGDPSLPHLDPSIQVEQGVFEQVAFFLKLSFFNRP